MPTDNSPVGYTCGTIDTIISYLEDIRSDNAELREWGNDLHEQLENMEGERDEALFTIKELEEQISDLQDERLELKSEINSH